MFQRGINRKINFNKHFARKYIRAYTTTQLFNHFQVFGSEVFLFIGMPASISSNKTGEVMAHLEILGHKLNEIRRIICLLDDHFCLKPYIKESCGVLIDV